jgi:hypothetical protein
MFQQALDGVQDGSGIIHHTKGINHRTELLFLKPSSDTISEARANKKH